MRDQLADAVHFSSKPICADHPLSLIPVGILLLVLLPKYFSRQGSIWFPDFVKLFSMSFPITNNSVSLHGAIPAKNDQR